MRETQVRHLHIPLPPVKSHQTGAVLVVALLFLLVMTLLGVASMRGTALQERMAGNQRDRNLALQAAETALRAGEEWLDTETNAYAADKIERLSNPATWDGADPVPTGKVPLDTGHLDSGDLSQQPAFHAAMPRYALKDTKAPSQGIRILHPVTALGYGGSDTAVVVVQSYCIRPCEPSQ